MGHVRGIATAAKDNDDIFADEPHEGKKQREATSSNKYIFSTEEVLDRKIATDGFLYDKFLQELEMVIDLLNPMVVQKELKDIYSELYPYYSNKEIISMSESNFYPKADLKSMELDIYVLYQTLINRRNTILDK